jgi:hypothetical protein
MAKFAAYIFCCLLSCLAVFQISLIFGAPWGHYAWGGQHEVLPTAYRIGSVGSIFIYALFTLVVLHKAKILHVIKNKKFSNIGIWVVFGYSVLGVLMNAASRSSGERAVMTPLVLVMAVLSFIIGRSKS